MAALGTAECVAGRRHAGESVPGARAILMVKLGRIGRHLRPITHHQFGFVSSPDQASVNTAPRYRVLAGVRATLPARRDAPPSPVHRQDGTPIPRTRPVASSETPRQTPPAPQRSTGARAGRLISRPRGGPTVTAWPTPRFDTDPQTTTVRGGSASPFARVTSSSAPGRRAARPGCR